MFTINDLLDQVNCQGKVRVIMNDEYDSILVFEGNNLNSIPYKYGAKELEYIYSEDDVTIYEVHE